MDASNELSGCEVLGYGIGHFYNDLCASMWFTYLLLFLEKVVVMRSSVAGLIMLIGQATDALSTAFIGVLSDSTPVPFCFRRCGQRKSWHALGTVLVTFSFAFVYNKCFMCNHSPTDWELFAWYAPYVVVFQIGWAAVQISHLALIPELASDEGRRMTLNSVRHGCTVVANLIIYAVLSVLLHFDDSGSAIGPVDLHHFSRIAGMVIVLGLFTETFFYTVTKEPLRIADTTVAMQSRYRLEILLSFRSSFLKWIYRLQFYKVGVLYVLSRLYINLSQVYFPFYITHIPDLSKKYVALLPMISYCSSFLISLLIGLPFFSRHLSSESLALFGCLCGISSCLMIQFDIYFSIYTTVILLGIAQAILLIASLSMVAKLIRQDTESSAFVYGVLSSMDKISNGLALQLIELFSSSFCIKSKSGVDCTSYYRTIVVTMPGSCLLIIFFLLLFLIISGKCDSSSR